MSLQCKWDCIHIHPNMVVFYDCINIRLLYIEVSGVTIYRSIWCHIVINPIAKCIGSNEYHSTFTLYNNIQCRNVCVGIFPNYANTSLLS